MPAHQVLLVVALFVGVNCEAEKDGEKKPAVVDWEKNNFGIRTSHSHDDVLNNLNIDTDAPQISKNEPRKKLIKPTIKRNKLRIRSRNKSESGEEPSELENTTTEFRSSNRFRSANSVASRKSSSSSSEVKSKRKDTTKTEKAEVIRSTRLRSRISPRLRATAESIIKVDTIEDYLRSSFKVKPNFTEFKENFMEKLTSSPRNFWHRNTHKMEKTTASPPTTFTTVAAGTANVQTASEETTATLKTIMEEFKTNSFWHRTTHKMEKTTDTTAPPPTTTTTAAAGTTNVQTESAETASALRTIREEFKTNSFWHRNTHKMENTSDKTASPPNTTTNTSAGTTNVKPETDETTTTLKTIKEESKTSDDMKHMTTESISSNTIIDDAVEFVTQPSSEKSMGRKKWPSKHTGDRKIPEIDDPTVKEKLNRLTIGQRGESRQMRKPDLSSRRMSIARSRGSIRTDVSSENSNGEVKRVDGTKAAKLDSRPAIRSRIRRPPGFKHQFRSNNIPNTKDHVVPKSIKRMRIKSNDRKIAQVESSSSKQIDQVNATVEPRHTRPSRFRITTGRRAPASITSPKTTHTETAVKRLRNPTGRRDHSTTTTTTTTTTTEKITISPNAHKISYTLNDSENPIVEHISELSHTIEHEPSQPVAQELISIVPIPDNMFSQATHQLMKAKKTSAEMFLPTLVPLLRNTPTVTLSHEVPIFVAGTKHIKEEEISVEDREVVLPSPVKMGRYILAATLNG